MTDRSNIFFDGNDDGKPGGALTALFGQKVTLVEADGDSASLSLTNGLLLLRNGQNLQLVGAGPTSTLSATIKTARTGSDRVVHLASISGTNDATNTLPRCTPTRSTQCIEVASISADVVDRLLASGELLDDPMMRFSRPSR